MDSVKWLADHISGAEADYIGLDSYCNVNKSTGIPWKKNESTDTGWKKK
jgi:hypothetical protein